MKQSVAILASGGGTTAEAFIRASQAGQIKPTVGLVICNNQDAGIFERVKGLNTEFGLSIPCVHINSQTHPAAAGEQVKRGAQTAAEQATILEILKAGNFGLIMLMGYMKRVGPLLIKEFGWRPEYTSPYEAMMLNTHPGLLPETKGLYGIYVQQHVLDKGLPASGQTLHVAAEDYDDGPTIAEHRVDVVPGDSAQTLFDRVQAAEKQHLPPDVAAFMAERAIFLDENGR